MFRFFIIITSVCGIAVLWVSSLYEGHAARQMSDIRLYRMQLAEAAILRDYETVVELARNPFADSSVKLPDGYHLAEERIADPCRRRAPVITGRGWLSLCQPLSFNTEHRIIKIVPFKMFRKIDVILPDDDWRLVHVKSGQIWGAAGGWVTNGKMFEPLDTTGWDVYPVAGLGLAIALPPPSPAVSHSSRVAMLVLFLSMLAAQILSVIAPRKMRVVWHRFSGGNGHGKPSDHSYMDFD